MDLIKDQLVILQCNNNLRPYSRYCHIPCMRADPIVLHHVILSQPEVVFVIKFLYHNYYSAIF